MTIRCMMGKIRVREIEDALVRPGIRKEGHDVGMRTKVARACKPSSSPRASSSLSERPLVLRSIAAGSEQRRRARIAMPPALFDGSLNPTDGRKIDPILVREMAANPDCRRLRIEGNTDALILQGLSGP